MIALTVNKLTYLSDVQIQPLPSPGYPLLPNQWMSLPIITASYPQMSEM